jgi:hypothetical protein
MVKNFILEQQYPVLFVPVRSKHYMNREAENANLQKVAGFYRKQKDDKFKSSMTKDS